MKKTKIKNNQSGFGLIQVVIAASLMSVLSLGMAGLITNQAQQISYMEDRMSHQNLRAEIEQLVTGNIENCTESVKDVKLPTGNQEVNIALKNEDGDVIFDPNDPTKNTLDKVKIDRVFVRDVDVHSGGTGSGEVEIVVNPVRLRKGGGPTDMAPVIIKRSVAMDTASNEIIACEGAASAGDLQCALRDLTERGVIANPAYDILERSSEAHTSTRTESFKLPNETTIVRLDLRRDAFERERCDRDYSCPGSNLLHTIYPGVTKIGGYTFQKGAYLQRKHIYYKKVRHETCSGNSSGTSRHYRVEYFYGSVKLATVYRSSEKKKRSCTYVTDHKPILNTNTLPPQCPVTSGRSVASIPQSLGFEIYTSNK